MERKAKIEATASLLLALYSEGCKTLPLVCRWLIAHANLFTAWLFNVTYSTSLVYLSTWVVVNVAPQAGGAGVAEVTAYLNGCNLPKVSTSCMVMLEHVLGEHVSEDAERLCFSDAHPCCVIERATQHSVCNPTLNPLRNLLSSTPATRTECPARDLSCPCTAGKTLASTHTVHINTRLDCE